MSALEQSLGGPEDPNNRKPPLDEPEQVYFEGNPRLRGELGMLIVWLIVAAVCVGTGFALYHFEWSSWIAIAIGIALGIVCLFVPALLVRRSHFRLTNYRIDFEFGILFKKYETLELWHVNDISLTQSPVDRIFKVGTIKVLSSDSSTPTLELRSLPDPRKLLEVLKQRVIAVKRQRGVVKLDMG